MKRISSVVPSVIIIMLLTSCGGKPDAVSDSDLEQGLKAVEEAIAAERNEETMTKATLPEELAQIPEDYFRYFMPSSGNLASDREYMASMVRDSGHTWDDFFIFAASGTDDFAYASFKYQIEAMANVSDGTFRYADNESGGNCNTAPEFATYMIQNGAITAPFLL